MRLLLFGSFSLLDYLFHFCCLFSSFLLLSYFFFPLHPLIFLHTYAFLRLYFFPPSAFPSPRVQNILGFFFFLQPVFLIHCCGLKTKNRGRVCNAIHELLRVKCCGRSAESVHRDLNFLPVGVALVSVHNNPWLRCPRVRRSRCPPAETLLCCTVAHPPFSGTISSCFPEPSL